MNEIIGSVVRGGVFYLGSLAARYSAIGISSIISGNKVNRNPRLEESEKNKLADKIYQLRFKGPLIFGWLSMIFGVYEFVNHNITTGLSSFVFGAGHLAEYYKTIASNS